MTRSPIELSLTAKQRYIAKNNVQERVHLFGQTEPHPLSSSSPDDPSVEVAEDQADKEALQREERCLQNIENLGS